MSIKAMLLSMLAALMLTGCGEAPAKSSKGPAVAPVGIYTSASECAERGLLSFEGCNTLVLRAVNAHRANARSYISRRLCEEKEGPDRCERTIGNAHTPKLVAILVTFGDNPSSIPMYAPADPKIFGFQNADKSRTVLAVDETVTVSENARRLAEGNVGK